MLNYRRHRPYLIREDGGRTRLIGRIVTGALAVLILWYLITRVLSLFDGSISRRAPATLTVRGVQDGVQVALQGEQWQRAESGLKLYPGDAVATRPGGDAVITLFDGSSVRLDQSSELSIARSDSFGSQGTSNIDITLKSGKLWVDTPSTLSFSGAIMRTIETDTYTASVPSDAGLLASASQVVVVRAAGVGVELALAPSLKQKSPLIVGEGQVVTLSAETQSNIKNGQDPYEFRDPVTPFTYKDPFLQSSYVLFSAASPLPGAEASAPATPLPTGEQKDLVITAPEQQQTIKTKTVSVAGSVSDRVALLLINGQPVTVQKDLHFTADVSLSKDATTTVRIEAQDVQGIPLAQAQRTVVNSYNPVVAPVRIKSPVGSGQTLTTALQEIEITGEAPLGTNAVIVNDYRLQLYKAGNKTWSYLASTALGNLVPGSNTFSAYALDADGNRSPARSITVVLTSEVSSAGTGAVAPPLKQNPPLSPGSLLVDAPVAGTAAETSEKEVVIEGRTSAETASISVNGYTLALYVAGKTTWNYIASTELSTMKRGRNIYRIVARNTAGEILDVLEYVITFNP